MPPLGHRCSYFCQEGIHALIVLTQPGVTAAEVEAAGQRFWAAWGTVQSVREAPEADINALAQYVQGGLTANNTLIRTTRHNPQCSVAWVVFLRTYAEEADVP